MAAGEARFGLAAGLLILSAIFPTAVGARGFVSFHFGVPLVPAAPFYYPPPVYYYPPPVYIYPPPVYISQSAPAQQVCHEYQTTAIIGGTPQPAYGRACLQPDGSWRIVQ